jgi:hypothetical protein
VLFLHVVIQGADEKTRKIRGQISKFERRMELVPRTGCGYIWAFWIRIRQSELRIRIRILL